MLSRSLLRTLLTGAFLALVALLAIAVWRYMTGEERPGGRV